MKTTLIASVLGLAATLATASPIDIVRRSTAPSTTYASPTGTSAVPYPSGTGSAVPYPTASGVAQPSGAVCSPNGALICNGPTQFGLCNWGHVVFQDVAAGTQCLDGKIVFAPGFGGQ